MKPEYWLERWQAGHIGFHRADDNPALVRHHREALGECIRVLVPLCGKSKDLEWLVVHGHEVVGIELSERAAQDFFAERGFTPARSDSAGFVVYSHGNLAIWVGDFFATSPEALGYCDAVYDRAALIALPEEMRQRYASHLQTLLSPKARMLLVTLYFDAPGGPPFSVSPEEVAALYPAAQLTSLSSDDARTDAPGPVQRGATFVHENSHLLELP